MLKIIKSFIYKIEFLRSIQILKFLYYNFFCLGIQRDSNVFLLPYRGSVIEIHRTAKIIIRGGNLELGVNRLKGSKAETYLKMEKYAKWNIENGCHMVYGSTIEISEGAFLEGSPLFINSGSIIKVGRKIRIGEDVWIGRNCCIYDSDFHSILNKDNSLHNPPKPVIIGDHVWLTNNIMVLKGVIIKGNNVINPFTVIRKDVPFGVMIANGFQQIEVAQDIKWSSARPSYHTDEI